MLPSLFTDKETEAGNGSATPTVSKSLEGELRGGPCRTDVDRVEKEGSRGIGTSTGKGPRAGKLP